MARCDFARWAPDGATPGGPITPRVLILHCTAIDVDAHPHGGLEWHFEVDFAGRLDQLVDTERRADANYKANPFAISAETWGRGETAWTDPQLATILRLCRWANATHGIPLRRCDRWDGSGIGHHTMWGAPSKWTPVAKSCPGPLRKRQFDELILPALTVPTPTPEENEMETPHSKARRVFLDYLAREPESPDALAWAAGMVSSGRIDELIAIAADSADGKALLAARRRDAGLPA